ncbi:MAG TPA: shikimate kinase [Blastocatellia bacterium]|nr:shikimate kinase [Blastocatellia bacterium]
MTADKPIFLVGFMGSGKTTVGRALAHRLGLRFVDLDETVEARAGKTIAEIFAEAGEAEFRRLEREALDLCRGVEAGVIALGGGAYESEANRAALRSMGRTVWLNCPLGICASRVSRDRRRPLVGDRAEMKILLDRRRANYALADHTVDVGSRTIREIVDEIVTLIR